MTLFDVWILLTVLNTALVVALALRLLAERRHQRMMRRLTGRRALY